MTKDIVISKTVEELYDSILATPKGQKRIRSGAFWKKFRFERRTRERVETVNAALRALGIVTNLDASVSWDRES